MKIALIGCGNIGTVIAQAIMERRIDVELRYVYDIDEEKARRFAKRYQTEYKNFDEILQEDLDLIVESASQEAVRILIPRALRAKKNVMIMSTGALVDENLLQEIRDLANKNNLKVYLPSGAIVGLDGIKSANIGEIKKVTLKTRKPPKSLKDALFFEKKSIDLDQIKNPTIIYEGPAKEAVSLFPANVNVAASLSLAGVGPEKTKVQIIVDPSIESNIHEIIVEGNFGRIKTRAENIPSPNNPKTSCLAALSAVATLKKITEPMQVGT